MCVGDSLVAEKHSHAKYRFWDLTIPLQHKTDRGPYLICSSSHWFWIETLESNLELNRLICDCADRIMWVGDGDLKSKVFKVKVWELD